MNIRFKFAAALLAFPAIAGAQVSLSITVAPPPLPVYVQPVIPSPGYIWTPGYWRWDAVGGDYFWVPGTWISPPYTGALWTPGYWGWGGGIYAWHGGYWATHVGFYGGVNYGFGYVGHGYEGGYWNGGVFNYNRSVNNVNTTIVRNVYNKTVVENTTRVSFNGGQGGVAAQPTNEERAVRAEAHTPPTQLQRQHEQVAQRDPAQRMAVNHGAPPHLASARPAEGRAAGPGGPHGDMRTERNHPEGPGGHPGGHPAAEHEHSGHGGERPGEHRQ